MGDLEDARIEGIAETNKGLAETEDARLNVLIDANTALVASNKGLADTEDARLQGVIDGNKALADTEDARL